MTALDTFKSLEYAGWEDRAGVYDQYTARFCRYGIEPLLDAAEIGHGNVMLDVCCGTGDASNAAAERGAIVTGLDFSERMIQVAKAKGGSPDFRVGDAEALPFEDAIFQRVICNFGILHLANADQAISEAARVLETGGRFAFSVWCGPEVSPLFRIFPAAVSAHGTMDVGLAAAPPMFRFADKSESLRIMQATGFTDVEFADVPVILEFELSSLHDFFDRSFVRTTMILNRQKPEARRLIEEELQRQLAIYSTSGRVRVPLPAIVVTGTKV